MTDPAPILDLIEAFRRSKTMFAAVELGIFDGERPQGAAVVRLLEACVALGLLEKRGDSFFNTPLAEEYLRRSSSHTLSGYIRYSNNALYPMWGELEKAVMEGTHRWSALGPGRENLFANFFQTDESKRDFLMGMHGFGMLSSPSVVAAFDLSRFKRMVDLGGATGHLAQAAKDRYPELDVAVLDLPVVADMFPGVIAGDFFADPLPPADLYAMGRILHDWSEDKIRVLLAKICAALPKGGALLIAERLIDEDRRGPVGAHMQSLNMLVVTEGRERTLSEYTSLLREAGFCKISGRLTGTPLDAVLAEK